MKIPGLFGFAADAYGFRHFIETLPDRRRAVWHGGQGHGWMTHFHAIPESGDGIVILTNSQRSWPFMSRVPTGRDGAARARTLIDRRPRATVGDQWIAGDHAVFAFRGIPCVAVTSSNLMERVVQLSHTAADTVGEVDVGLLDATAEVVAKLAAAE